MTESQKQALDKASQILGEHFEHHVVIVGFEVMDEKTERYSTAGTWDGGIPTAIGLCEIHRRKLLKMHLEPSDEDDDAEPV